jgi:hypothetical protein
MKSARWLAGVLAAAMATAAIGYASRAPFTQQGADAARLRMSWRLRGEKIESCRNRTEEELAALPVHMRTPQICTSKLLSYRLIVEVEGLRTDTVRILPAGAKGDRPIFVLHDIMLPPGDYEVEVEFEPEDVASKHEPMEYEGVVHARPGSIALITIAPNARALVLRQ